MHISPPSLIYVISLLSTITHASPADSVSTITVAAPPSPTSPSYTSDSTFKADILKAHNFYRSAHNASALTWNDTSTSYASNWVKGCVFKHTGGPTGENLAAGYANATAAVDGWGGERQAYNFGKPTGFSEKTGHFTAVVWRNTTSVGCARFQCDGKNKTPGFYIVCEYFPPGNVGGNNNQYYKDNVQKQTKGKSSDTVETGVTGAACSFKTGDDGAMYWLLRWPSVWLLYQLSKFTCE